MALLVPSESEILSSTSQSSQFIKNKTAVAKDVFVNRTAISPERYNDIYGTLMGFGKGTPIVVEYYQIRGGVVNKKTNEIDFSLNKNPAHYNILLVHDFEIRLDDQLSISYDQTTMEMTATGEGVTYPGFMPNKYDLFIYPLPNSQLGLFQINDIERLSIQDGTYHKISFNLREFIDQEILNKLTAGVAEESFFVKDKYLTGNSTLLHSENYIHLKNLKDYRKKLVQKFLNRFYSEEFDTIIRKNAHGRPIYDPYVVEFFLAKVSMLDLDKDIRQLYPIATSHTSSLWYLLISSFGGDISDIKYQKQMALKDSQIWGASINALNGVEFVILEDIGLNNPKERLIESKKDDSYVLSKYFYHEDYEKMCDLEKLIYDSVQGKTIDICEFINNYLIKANELSETDIFYRYCLYIYLIDVAINQIT